MIPKVTIVYLTNRRVPKWEWFVASLNSQIPEEMRWGIELLFIDGLLWDKSVTSETRDEIALSNPLWHDTERKREIQQLCGGKFSGLHIPPLPCAWQGPFRQTSKDWFCAGNARNTAVVVARNPYLVYVDDLSVLTPSWFNQVLHAALDGYVVCGAYKKVKQLKVTPDGKVESYEKYPAGVDARWDRGSDGGVVPWHGTAMYGCSFGLPLEAMLEVDGNDNACNGQGFEDYELGIRLERAGWPFFYNRNMLTLESDELHKDGTKLPMERKAVTPDRLPKNYESYRHPNHDERHMSDHVVLNRVCNETDRIRPIIGSNLRSLRERYQATGLVPIPRSPETDWRDGMPLSML